MFYNKLSKTKRQVGNVSPVGFNSSLYNDTNKVKNVWTKNVKITQLAHAFKSYASSYNIEILNSFNNELQLKDTEYAIENKLKKILSEWRGFKFVATLVLVF